MIRGQALVVTGLAVGFWVINAQAQTPSRPDAPRLVVSAGLVAARGYAIGARSAELRRNSTITADPFTLFRTESNIDGAAGFDVRVAYALSRAFSIEAAATFSRPSLGVRVFQDSEGTLDSRVSESIDQYTVEVSGLWQFPGRPFGAKARPYAIGGAGYLRQLHEDRVLVETGQLGFGGGGVQYWLRRNAGKRAIGIRGEACAVFRTRGIDFEDKGRVYPRLSALALIGF
jgi:hypothetical protein